jgi:hypothetical protein
MQVMKKTLLIGSTSALLLAGILGCSSMGSASKALSLYEQLGGSSSMSSVASGFVGSSLKDPRLSSLTAGKSIDPTAASSKVSDQLCSMLGGGCKAPVTDSQIASAASKVSPAQSQAISDNFSAALKSVVSDPHVQQLVTNAVGGKVAGVLGSIL